MSEETRDVKLLRLSREIIDLKTEKKEQNKEWNKRIKDLEAEVKILVAD